VAGVSQSVLRLTGDTFHQFKGEYRKMSKGERLGILAQMQMRIAAIYAIENEDMQRQQRLEQQERRHRQIEESRRQLQADKSRMHQQQQAQQQAQAAQQMSQQSPHRQRRQPQQQNHQLMLESQHHAQQMSDNQALQDAMPQLQGQQDYLEHQFQIQIPQQTPVPTPHVPQFHHYPEPPQRLRSNHASGSEV
jgi:hypothetical protein